MNIWILKINIDFIHLTTEYSPPMKHVEKIQRWYMISKLGEKIIPVLNTLLDENDKSTVQTYLNLSHDEISIPWQHVMKAIFRQSLTDLLFAVRKSNHCQLQNIPLRTPQNEKSRHTLNDVIII